MGLKRRLIKLLAVAWQQHHLHGSPLGQPMEMKEHVRETGSRSINLKRKPHA